MDERLAMSLWVMFYIVVCLVSVLGGAAIVFYWCVLWEKVSRDKARRSIELPLRIRIKAYNKQGRDPGGYYTIHLKTATGWYGVTEFLTLHGRWEIRLERYAEAVRLAKLWKENPDEFWASEAAQVEACNNYRAKKEAERERLFPVDEQEI